MVRFQVNLEMDLGMDLRCLSVDLADFFSLGIENLEKKSEPVLSRSEADEIWQKVRKVKEGSNNFRWREQSKRANVIIKN